MNNSNPSLEEIVDALAVNDAGKAAIKEAAHDRIRQLAEARLVTAAEFILSLAESKATEKEWEPIHQTLDASPRDQLDSIFSAACGDLGSSIAASWIRLRSMPLFSIFGNAPPVRLPHSPSATREGRRQWLSSMVSLLHRFPQDLITPEWLSVHATGFGKLGGVSFARALFGLSPDGGYVEDAVGRFLGCVMAEGGTSAENVFDTLALIARGKHPVGERGGHVYRGLWMSGQERAREILCERLTESDDEDELERIVRAASEGGPEAIASSLRQAVHRGLLDRKPIAAVVGSWFGLSLTEIEPDTRNGMVEPFLASLEYHLAQEELDFTPIECDAATGYKELFVEMIFDATNIGQRGLDWFDRVELEDREVIVKAVRQPPLPSDLSPELGELWLRSLESEDMELAAVAMWWERDYPSVIDPNRLVEAVEKWLQRLKGAKKVAVDGEEVPVRNAREKLYKILGTVAKSLELPKWMEHAEHAAALRQSRPFRERLAEIRIRSPQERASLIRMIQESESSPYTDASCILPPLVRDGLSVSDLPWIVSFFKVPEGLRLTVQFLSSDDLQPIVDRLLTDTKQQMRLHGFGLLEEMIKSQKSLDWVGEQILELGQRKKLTKKEKTYLALLAKLLPSEAMATATETAGEWGAPDAERIAVTKPRLRTLEVNQKSLVLFWDRLSQLFESHSNTFVRNQDALSGELVSDSIGNVKLLSAVTLGYGSKAVLNHQFPLAEVWQTWFESSDQAALHDSDVLAQLVLASRNFLIQDPTISGVDPREWLGERRRKSSNSANVGAVLTWLAMRNANQSGAQFLLDCCERHLAAVSEEEWKKQVDPMAIRCRRVNFPWQSLLQEYCIGFETQIPVDVASRWWQLATYFDRPYPDVPRCPPPAHLVAAAFGAGAIGEKELVECWDCPAMGETAIETATSVHDGDCDRVRRYASSRAAEYDPTLRKFVGDVVRDALDEESPRQAEFRCIASQFGSYPGIGPLMDLVKSLGNKKLSRLSVEFRTPLADTPKLVKYLLRKSLPADGETFEQFHDACQRAQSEAWMTDTRLLELALFAPQWSQWIEDSIGCPGLSEASRWLSAHLESARDWDVASYVFHHMQPNGRFPTADERTEFRTQRAKHSPLATRGRVSMSEPHCWKLDIEWFERIELSSEGWEKLCEVLHAIATPQQSLRMQRVVATLLGTLSLKQIGKAIKEDLRDVQLLGLLPVATGAAREADIAERMRMILDHRRQANRMKFTKREMAIEGNENTRQMLSVRAGINDPQRLDWYAMVDVQERIDAISPIAADDVTLTLNVQANGLSVIHVCKNGKTQKSIPAKLAKRKDVKQLKDLNKELRQLGRQTARSLENAMVQGATFDPAELTRLLSNPLIEPALTSLVLIQGERIGILSRAKDALVLTDLRGKERVVDADAELRIAHVSDLFQADCLAGWRDTFADRVQAFEQVHRDLFRPTAAELKTDPAAVIRFADFPVREDQASAILDGSGWRVMNEMPWCREKNDPASSVRCIAESSSLGEFGQICFKSICFVDRHENRVPLNEVHPRFLSESVRAIHGIVTVAEAKQDEDDDT